VVTTSNFFGAACKVATDKAINASVNSLFIFNFEFLIRLHGSFTSGTGRTQMLRKETELL